MAKLSTYPILSSISPTDLVPITSGGGTQNVEVQTLVPSATALAQGKVKIAGELSGTADAVTLNNMMRVFNVKDAAYGAAGDGQKVTDGAMTAGSSTLTSASGLFVSGDVGKLITIQGTANRTSSSSGAITSGTNTLSGSSFSSIDVGRPIKVAGAGTSGADLTTTIASYTSSSSVTLTDNASTTVSSATVTIGSQGLAGTITAYNSATSVTVSFTATWTVTGKIVYWGTNDATPLQSALTAAGAVAGRPYFPRGIYLTNAALNLPYSGSYFLGDGWMSSRIVTCASNINTINISATSKQLEDIRFYNLAFDVNDQINSRAISFTTGNYSTGDYIRDVIIENCKFENLNIPNNGFVQLNTGRSSPDRGPFTGLTIRNCDFGKTVQQHIYIQGNDVTDLLIDHCHFHDSGMHCFAFNEQSRADNSVASLRSHKNWEIKNCYFYNNSLSKVAGTYAINDVNRNGVRGFNIHHNFFDTVNTTQYENFAIFVHKCWGLKIHHNYFWKIANCVAIGQSGNGSIVKQNPEFMVEINNNIFYRCHGVADHDASVYALWEGNMFYELQAAGGIGSFGRHWPDRYVNNFFYNSPVVPGDGGQDQFGAFATGDNGTSIHGNIIVDDRLLADPTTAPVLTQTSGGSLSSRTYYVKYTWANDTGETLASSESSLTVSANNLLVVTHPYTSSYGPPSGAKKINIYISTSAGTETLQDYVPTAWQTETETELDRKLYGDTISWTEPTTGLISGAGLPTTNTTQPLCIYGIYENSGGVANLLPGIYKDNEFYGIPIPILGQSTYKRVTKNNIATGYFKNPKRVTNGSISSSSTTLTLGSSAFASSDVGKTIIVFGAGTNSNPLYTTISAFTSGTQVTLAKAASATVSSKVVVWGTNTTIDSANTASLEFLPYDQGNVSGATTFNVANGEIITFTLTGNVTTVLSTAHYIGQRLTLIGTQDSTGGWTMSNPSNAILAGDAFAIKLTSGAINKWVFEADSNLNWVETGAPKNNFLTVGTSFADYIVDGTNDNVQIQAALDAVNTLGGGTILLKRPPSGIYTVTTTMSIGSNTRILGEDGVTIKKANSQNTSVFVNKDTTNGNSDIVIENLIIDQNGANQSAGGGCSFTGLFNSRLENVVFKASRVFNLFVGSLAGTSLTGTLTFTNADTTVTGSSTLFTTELAVGDIIKSNAGHFQRVTSIASNTSLELDRAWGWPTESGVAAKKVPANSHNRLINCKFGGTIGSSDNVGLGLFDFGLVQGCVSTGANGYGFGPDHANYTKFIGNTCYGNTDNGIGMETCGYCVVTGNVLYNNIANGVGLLSGAYRNIISNNQCRKNTSGIVISYQNSSFPFPDENKIIGNTCEFNTTDGVNMNGTQNGIISHNHCANNGNAGIRIQTGSSRVPDKTSIIGNICYDNQDTKTQDRGIHIAQGTNTLVTNNIALASDHTVAGITDSGTASTLANNLT